MRKIEGHGDKAKLIADGKSYTIQLKAGYSLNETITIDESNEHMISLDNDDRIDGIIYQDVWHKVIYNSEIKNKIQQSSNQKKWQQKNQVNKKNSYRNFKERAPATAPYNFITLPDKIVTSDSLHAQVPKFSGRIDVRIKTLTNVFIRNKSMDENFFHINNKDRPVIPGSSLRGLIRSLTEIIGYSRIHFLTEKSIYKRLRFKRQYPIIGFLKYVKNEYKVVIIDSHFNPEERPGDGSFSYQIATDKVWSFQVGYKKPNSNSFNVAKKWTIKLPDSYESAEEYVVSKDAIESYQNDYDRKAYNDDLGQDDKHTMNNILKIVKDGRIDGQEIPAPGLPVFCTINDNNKEVTSIGHCKYHRVTYPHRIADHIPKQLTEEEYNDFASTIFGAKDATIPGKVFFEDSPIENPGSPQEIFEENKLLKILSKPNPKSYQLYLDQEGLNDDRPSYKLSDCAVRQWHGKENTIRGYKQYWHRNMNASKTFSPFEEVGTEKSNSHTDPIKAVKPGNSFLGCIRFEKLTEVELGLLLSAIDLPKGCRHKIGLGKPLGLGSIKMTPALLTIYDQDGTNKSVFKSDKEGGMQWNMKSIPCNMQSVKLKFQKYLSEKLTSTDSDIWNIPRLKRLKDLLTFEGTDTDKWLAGTNYQKFSAENKKDNQFLKKNILPIPKEVIDLYMKKPTS